MLWGACAKHAPPEVCGGWGLILDVVTADLRGATAYGGIFRHNASLAIPHCKSFAAIPSFTIVLPGHTNRNVSLSHESRHEIALVYHREVGEKKAFVWQGLCFWHFAGHSHREDSNPNPNRNRIARYNATKRSNDAPARKDQWRRAGEKLGRFIFGRKKGSLRKGSLRL